MPDTDPKDPPEDDEVDTFSRGDGEGRPGPDEVADPAALDEGEEDGFDTDTFSRNDSEGLPGVEDEG
jgi:hypothetical protein